MNSLPPNGHLYPIDPLTLYPEFFHKSGVFVFSAIDNGSCVSSPHNDGCSPRQDESQHQVSHCGAQIDWIQTKHVFEIKGAINQDMCEYMYSEEKHTHPI